MIVGQRVSVFVTSAFVVAYAERVLWYGVQNVVAYIQNMYSLVIEYTARKGQILEMVAYAKFVVFHRRTFPTAAASVVV